jgi:N-acetylglucosaminyldiphosphoundecaprenol N-acetyl-beta-D-mannosaminyltransferase
MSQTLDVIDQLVAARRPSLVITPNLNYVMIASKNPDLPSINLRAALSMADGMVLVIASRWKARRLPERVTGSDLIFRVSERAAQRGYRLFFLGGANGVAVAAAENLKARYPGLQVVGVENPILSQLSPAELNALFERIHLARPHILITALSQPSGERWLDTHLERLAVPVCAQFGAAIDFAAGRVRRAPRWMQKMCLEWLYRALQEPRRLGPRYLNNALFIIRMLGRDLTNAFRGRVERPPDASISR